MTDKLYFGATTACHLNQQPNTFMRTQLFKRLNVLLCFGFLLLGANYRMQAQISVGPTGSVINTFATQPVVADGWSTVSVGTSGATYGAGGLGNLENHIVTNTLASAVNVAIGSSGTVNPPSAFATARRNTVNLNVQTRPTGNDYLLLMATIRNDTGSNVSSVNISYSYGVDPAAPPVEEMPGHRAFYSFTGLRNSWQPLPSLSGLTTAGSLSATIPFNWASTSNLYIIWADDNADGGTEGVFTIDDFRVTAVPAGAPVILQHPQPQSVVPSGSATLSVQAFGALPLTYYWRLNSNVIAVSSSPTYTINNATLANQGFYSVIVSNSSGTATSTNAFVTVACSAPASIVGQPADQNLSSGGTINLGVSVAGTAPFSYQWFRNGSPLLNATNSTFTKANASIGDSGFYSVSVNNCAGTPAVSSNAIVSVSGESYVAIGLTSQLWKYRDDGVDRGTEWRGTNYDDSAWPSGQGVFAGGEDNAVVVGLRNTIVSLTNAAGARFATYYFRTTFNITNTDLVPLTLIASNLVDDGMIIYLNGAEVLRYNMPGGVIDATDVALAANPGGEGVFIISNLPPSSLVAGQNVLAVEVHQNSTASSDVVFGTGLIVAQRPPTPLTVTNQPSDLIVEETKRAEFPLGLRGEPAYIQWYHDGVAVPNAIFAPLVIENVTTNDAGTYWAVATNSFNSVTSIVVTLTITGDTNSPRLVEADGTFTGGTNILVSFSEAILPSTATNLSNYLITNTGGSSLSITRAVVQNGTNVLLTTAARAANVNWILVVNNIRDISPRQNLIAPNSTIPIRSLVALVGLGDAGWRFYNPNIFLPQDLGTAWKEFTYFGDTNVGWGANGISVFYNGAAENIPGPVGTALAQTSTLTSYFRKLLQNIQFSPGGLKLQISHVIDDGAVMYLNGAEFFRYNMPADPINYQTPALSEIGNLSRIGPISLDLPSLRQGSNVLAVELHTSVGASVDKYFGVQLNASVQSFSTGAVVITGGPDNLTVLENSSATFCVIQSGGATFQWQRTNNVNGWTNIPGATNQCYTIAATPITASNALFRVAVSNSTSGAISGNAVLTVLPDAAGPQLLSGFADSNRIVITFDEPVTVASAQVNGNYLVTNSVGQSIPVTGAALANGTNVTLTFASLLTPATYFVAVTNVRDISVAATPVSPGTYIRVGYSAMVVTLSNSWRYDDRANNYGSPTNWAARTYDDSTWKGPSNALFGAERGVAPNGTGTAYPGGIPVPVRTGLILTNFLVSPPTNVATYYFRTHFNSYASGRGTMTLRTILDDGAVVYLNGVEVYRQRMAAGVPAFTTLANASVGDAAFEGPFTFPVTNVLAGDNVIAVEVHQSSLTSSDVEWAGEFTVNVTPIPVNPGQAVLITTQPRSRTNSVHTVSSFNVVAVGGAPLHYQWRKNGVDLPNQTNTTLAFIDTDCANAGTYTVVVSNSFSSATSVAATLVVSNCVIIDCPPIPNWTNQLRFTTIGTNNLSAKLSNNVTRIILTWNNPPTNTCGSNAAVVLQRAMTITGPWTNIFTNVSGPAKITNAFTGTNAFYRLQVP